MNRSRRIVSIGLTGGIGSGKSEVCRIFASLGVPCYDSDARARALMNGQGELRDSLVALFGEQIYGSDGLDRRALAARVFSDPEQLRLLNAAVHPAVGRDFEAWREACRRQGAQGVVLESAILFESGFDALVDVTVSVSAPLEERVRRVAARDGMEREAIRRRIAAQMSDAERERRADRIVRNDDLEGLRIQVEALYDELFSGETLPEES